MAVLVCNTEKIAISSKLQGEEGVNFRKQFSTEYSVLTMIHFSTIY